MRNSSRSRKTKRKIEKRTTFGGERPENGVPPVGRRFFQSSDLEGPLLPRGGVGGETRMLLRHWYPREKELIIPGELKAFTARVLVYRCLACVCLLVPYIPCIRALRPETHFIINS